MKSLKSFLHNEDLRQWFSKTHPKGDWKRINSKGEVVGPCAREPGEAKPKCMSKTQRSSLSKTQRAAAVRAKRKHDPNPERKGAPINVSSTGKRKMSEDMEHLEEKNKPTNPKLWSRAVSLARSKFDVYPSAYANGWASKWYKSKGGGWKSVKEEKQPMKSFKAYISEAEDKKDTITFNIPLMIRMLELAREDIKDDLELHRITERLIDIRKKGVLTMDDYNFIAGLKEEFNIIDDILTEDHVRELESGLHNLDKHDYDTIHKLMMKISANHDITGKELHNDFKKKHGKTPDDWIKQELDESAAWKRKEGKDPKGGLNRKGIMSYRRENPGSKLSMAVTTKPSKLKKGSKAANRRKSFCARMKGMKKRLTSAKTARDPNSRINKSLRKWNCR